MNTTKEVQETRMGRLDWAFAVGIAVVSIGLVALAVVNKGGWHAFFEDHLPLHAVAWKALGILTVAVTYIIWVRTNYVSRLTLVIGMVLTAAALLWHFSASPI